MANHKTGLDYFEHYIGMTNDDKIADLRMKYGSVAIDVWIILLDMIYGDKGYYIEYGSPAAKKRVVWKILGIVRGKYPPTPETVSAIIEDLAACDLFSGDLLSSGILSSKRIQEQYYKATVERKAVDIIPEYWLLDIGRMKKLSEKNSILRFFQNQPVIVQNRPVLNDVQPVITQSKAEKSKVEYSIISDTSAVDDIFELFNRICVSFPKVTVKSPARVKAVKDKLDNGVKTEDFERLFLAAENSDFLKGKNNRNWSADFDWLIKDDNMAKTLDGNYGNKTASKKYSYNIDEYKALVNNF